MIRPYNCPYILGGDWNATLDISNVNHNLDILNMQSIPSLRRSTRIHELCRNFNLIEPFRTRNPNKKEYTFIPGGNNNNRSRLDFFLISTVIYNPETLVTVPHSLTSTLFDHKPVTLIIKRKKLIQRNIIKDTVLKNPDLDAHVKCAVFECYLQHWVPLPGNVRDQLTKNEHIASIGRIYNLLNEINAVEMSMALNGFTNVQDLILNGKRAEIRLLFDDMPNLDYFENLGHDFEPEIFFQTIVNGIKNNVLSHQASIFKLRFEKKNRLSLLITDLKKNFNQNTVEILNVERQLSELVEGELRDELLHFKKFETLNAEKITPYFMNLVKSISNTGSIMEIKKDDGTNFENENETKDYIQNYYKDIYSQQDNDAKHSNIETINTFLGPLKNHPIVLESKLTDAERDELDVEISLIELTQSINNANMSSAPGADGISNRFIKNYWDYFKSPLLKLCNSCYEQNKLPSYFLSANIKLIPKKGDLSKIKNWRPISLLNCFYKIISRVITARLRKYMDKMTPICQKGYSNTRYCQEVLISVIEGIEKCKNKQKNAAVVSLDIKKAFDSLSHSFLQGVYDFFNIGPRLKKWITMLSTKRRACVILEGGKVTEFFDLERGNAQGDTISPFLFNLGYQILLFKLELCFQIEGTLKEEARSINSRVNATTGRAALVSPDPKVSAMADDCTLLVDLTYNNLKLIINYLEQFEKISGLGCNVEKTMVMPVDINQPVPQNVVDLGIQIVNEIFLLGTVLKNTGTCFEPNSEKILEKIRKQVNFWTRFNLSLPGRVTVAKTFMYSQLNYLGCILPLGKTFFDKASLLIEKFVRGKLHIGKNKIYAQVIDGGLGMFNLQEFLNSQCCAWVRRSVTMDELWKRELFALSYGSVFNLRKKSFSKKTNPILYYIAECYEKFLFCFTAKNENFAKAPIYENPCLAFDVNNPNYLSQDFFTVDEYDLYKDGIQQLSMDHLMNADFSLKTKPNFETSSNIIVTDIKFRILQGLVLTSIAKYSKIDNNSKKTDTAKNFCMRIKRGSRRYRNITTATVPEEVSTNILRYADILDQAINFEKSKRLNLQWNWSFLDNATRTFIFKMHHNLLGINTRVAHFVRNHPRTCTFCSVSQDPDDSAETISHLFFECRHVEHVLESFFRWIFNNANHPLSPREFFQGFDNACSSKNLVLDLVNLIVKKYIWDCKLHYTLPSFPGLQQNFIGTILNIYKISTVVRDNINKTGIFRVTTNLNF